MSPVIGNDLRSHAAPNRVCSIRFETASASSTTVFAPSRPIWTGLNASFCFTANSIPGRWARLEVEAFLTHLAVDRNVAAATQNQARSALLFLYKEVLGIELPWLDDVEHGHGADAFAGRADAGRSRASVCASWMVSMR